MMKMQSESPTISHRTTYVTLAASILIKNNLDPRTVSGVLGHADPSTTLNIYSYFFHQKSQEAADIMQKELFKKRSV